MPSWLIGSDLQGRAEVHINAPPDQVFPLIAEVTRMGEWSPECRRCKWLDGATGPAVSARFRGHNKRGWLRWGMTCVVTELQPGRVFAFETRPPGGRVQSLWRFQLEPIDGGTRVVESFQILWYIRMVMWFTVGGRAARQAELEKGIHHTLERIKATAEAAGA